MTRANSTSRTLPRRLAAAVGFAAAVALAASTTPFSATAEPSSDTWDLEAYEDCLKSIPEWERHSAFVDHALESCCLNSGGLWHGDSKTCTTQVPGSNRDQAAPGVSDNPQVAPPPPQAPPRRDLSRIPFDNAPINPGPSAPTTTPVPGLS
jgi:hypothetical protein